MDFFSPLEAEDVERRFGDGECDVDGIFVSSILADLLGGLGGGGGGRGGLGGFDRDVDEDCFESLAVSSDESCNVGVSLLSFRCRLFFALGPFAKP